MNTIDRLMWNHVAFPLADWLARLGVMEARWAWRLTYRLSPAIAGLAALIAASAKPSNVFFWVWAEPDQGDDLEGLLADVSESIERAPSPGGLDVYWVEVERLEPLAGDQHGVDVDQTDATLLHRKTIARRCVKGDRYFDWKRGLGKDAVKELLAWARPTAGLPVSVVRVTVDGDAVARAMIRWNKAER